MLFVLLDAWTSAWETKVNCITPTLNKFTVNWRRPLQSDNMKISVTTSGSQSHDSLYPPYAFRCESTTKYFLPLRAVSQKA